MIGTGASQAAHLYPEKHYQKLWCDDHKGVLEFRLQDGARVDCLTDEYAVEFDFATKWAESIGQALYYAGMTGKRPGVVLIMERGDDDGRYLKRLQSVADQYGIQVWTTRPEE
ncbi:hypothetical protein GSbR_19330 [Geobacter sp. SVR]|nr:hypothetical protein GSVR_34600 [Geobacter sp. SVR]GCF85333.1 hypothetical protein GSbR_19330 [Geobacter sp. SVR]